MYHGMAMSVRPYVDTY